MTSKWEDTVMGHTEITEATAKIPHLVEGNIAHHRLVLGKIIARKQAEITWHARDGEIEEAEKRGAEKVVEWIEKTDMMEATKLPNANTICIGLDTWRAFLKDLGIEVKE